MRKHVLTLMLFLAAALTASAQGIIVHETNDNQTAFKTTDVSHIEFTESNVETTTSSYATKQELKDGLDAKADKSDLDAVNTQITSINASIAALKNSIAALQASIDKVYVEVEMKADKTDLEAANERIAALEALVSSLQAQIAQGGGSNSTTHEYVDLGLSVKWATCNVGASSPEDYGGYYAWGETETKSTYDWSTYFDTTDGGTTFTKYATDKKTVLDAEDDVAHVKWGGNWRMPTDAELTELRTKCTWIFATQNGMFGYKVTGTNGNSIFLPAAGYCNGGGLIIVGTDGYYWSSSLNSSYSYVAWSVYFDSSNVYRFDNGRCDGRSVRPVCP